MLINSNPLTKKIYYFFNLIMVAVYLSFGFLFLFTDIADDLFSMYRTPLGLIMSSYACFRGYKTYAKIIKGNEN